MIPLLMALMGVVGWLFSLAAAVWYLKKFHELHQELRTIRRYLQAIHDRLGHRP